MRRCLLTAVFVFLLALAAVPRAVADEQAARAEVGAQVVQLFGKRDFAALDALADEYRETQARTSSGKWKLSLFYGAFDGMPPGPHVDAWIAERPDSPAAHIVKAMFMKNRAGQIRGGKPSKDTPKENLVRFVEELAKASAYLHGVKKTAAADPEWYALTVSIMQMLGAKDEEFDKLVWEGIDRHPGYYGIPFAAVWYMTPKWGGSAEKIEDFANKVAARTRETEGMGMYARIYWLASEAGYGPFLFEQTKVEWPKMKQGIRDVLEKYPDQWNLNHFAYFSCRAGDRDFTKELMDRIDAPLDLPWQGVKLFAQCKDFAAGGG